MFHALAFSHGLFEYYNNGEKGAFDVKSGDPYVGFTNVKNWAKSHYNC